MTRKTLLAAALAASSLIGIATTAHAIPAVVAPSGPVYYGNTVYVHPAPPAPIYEAVPATRAGYSWSPGYYEFRGNQYVWTSGRWIENRQGYAWQQPHWRQRGDGSWVLLSGQWVRIDNLARNEDFRRGPNGDRDGDGVLNRFDNDRDGDGVMDQYDNFPNNPNRS